MKLIITKDNSVVLQSGCFLPESNSYFGYIASVDSSKYGYISSWTKRISRRLLPFYSSMVLYKVQYYRDGVSRRFARFAGQ